MKKPNILFVLSDDQGAWAMHCAGCKALHTPNLDALAQSGLMFQNFFCASPVCSPARASILTGTIPSCHGVHDWIASGNVDKERFEHVGKNNPYGGYEEENVPIQYLKGQTTYTDVLKENGYNVALSGKWHLGDSVSKQHGFTKWYTIGKGGCMYFHPDIVYENEIHMHDGEYVTDLITDKAIEFVHELSHEKEPFYLSVHYTAPHSPWGKEHHQKEFLDLYEACDFNEIPNVPDHPDMTTGPVYGTDRRKENLQGYFAAISAMDNGIGKIIQQLKDENVYDNTIIVFTADNGMSMGHHGIWGKGNGTFPMNMYDTAVKVPFIISCPALIKQGVTDEMVSAYDIFPTFVDFLNLPSKASNVLPGASFAPLLKGEKKGKRQEVVIFDEYGPVRMVRTKEFKYVHRYPYGPHELFDLVHDKEEEHNLYNDAKYQDIVVDMRARLHDFYAKYADKNKDGLYEEVTGSGQLTSAGVFAEKKNKYAPIPKTRKEL